MTDHDALLAAILANRADDTPRLAFADYLENDAYPLQPERGEFIRVQCELAIREKSKGPPKIVVDGRPQKCKKCRGWYGKLGRCGCEYGDRRKANQERLINERAGWLAEIDELRRRERELIEAHGAEWSKSLSEACHYSCRRDITDCFSRGFVAKVRIPWSDWRTHADAILARQPIERVAITTVIGWDDEEGLNFYQHRDSNDKPIGTWGNARWTDIEFEFLAEGGEMWIGRAEEDDATTFVGRRFR